MSRFLFRFGFCTPEQWKANKIHGWDDESSEAFFVVADTQEAALAWGRDVAELFCQKEFEAAGWCGEIPSWKAAKFAFWIEAKPECVFPADILRDLPEVSASTMPDFSTWKRPDKNRVDAQ